MLIDRPVKPGTLEIKGPGWRYRAEAPALDVEGVVDRLGAQLILNAVYSSARRTA